MLQLFDESSKEWEGPCDFGSDSEDSAVQRLRGGGDIYGFQPDNSAMNEATRGYGGDLYWKDNQDEGGYFSNPTGNY